MGSLIVNTAGRTLDVGTLPEEILRYGKQLRHNLSCSFVSKGNHAWGQVDGVWFLGKLSEAVRYGDGGRMDWRMDLEWIRSEPMTRDAVFEPLWPPCNFRRRRVNVNVAKEPVGRFTTVEAHHVHAVSEMLTHFDLNRWYAFCLIPYKYTPDYMVRAFIVDIDEDEIRAALSNENEWSVGGDITPWTYLETGLFQAGQSIAEGYSQGVSRHLEELREKSDRAQILERFGAHNYKVDPGYVGATHPVKMSDIHKSLDESREQMLKAHARPERGKPKKGKRGHGGTKDSPDQSSVPQEDLGYPQEGDPGRGEDEETPGNHAGESHHSWTVDHHEGDGNDG